MRRRRKQGHSNGKPGTLVVAATSNESRGVPAASAVHEVLEAEDKLRQLLSLLEDKRRDAAFSLVTSVARQLSVAPTRQEPVLALYEDWETKDNQLGAALDGLNDVLSMLLERKDFFTRHHQDEVVQALTTMLAPLNDRKAALSAGLAVLTQEIRALQAEIDQLQTGKGSTRES